MALREITRKELVEGYKDFLTVGKLKKFLDEHNLPDTAKVVIQRVEDIYYEKHSWGVFFKEGEHTFRDPKGNIDKESLEQYHPAWCCVKYEDEKDILFIDLHY